MQAAGLWRRSVVEGVGTAVLVLVGAASVVAALRLGGAALRLDGGAVGHPIPGFISLAFAMAPFVGALGGGPARQPPTTEESCPPSAPEEV